MSFASGSSLEYLRHDLSLLANDYALIEKGYKLSWALSHTELYRFLHPLLDYLQTTNRKRYFSRQFAVSLFFYKHLPKHRLLLPASRRAYHQSPEDIAKQARQLVNNTEIDWDNYLTEEASGSAFRNACSLLEKVDFKSVGISGKELTRNMLDVLKGDYIKNQYLSGASLFKTLVDDEMISSLPTEKEKELKDNPSTRQVYESILEHLNKCRPDHDKRKTNRTDADDLANLAELNRPALDTHHLYVTLFDVSFSRDRELCSDLSWRLDSSDYGMRFPLIRTLNYCLLDAYFRLIRGYTGQDLVNQAKKMHNFVDSGLNIMNESKSALERRNELDKTRAKTNKILMRFASLSIWSDNSDALDELIKTELGDISEPSEGGPLQLIPSERVVQKIHKFEKDTEQILDVYSSIEQDMNGLRKELSDVVAEMRTAQKDPAQNNPAYGGYHDWLLKHVKLALKKELLEIFEELSKRDNVLEIATSTLSRLKALLEKNENVAAIYIGLSICSRRMGRYETSLEQLDIADTIEPGNPESLFQRAILIRVTADFGKLPPYDKMDQFQQAERLALQAKESKYSQPKYSQFLAYIAWRIVKIERDGRQPEDPTGATQKSIKKSAKYCLDALNDFNFKPESFSEIKQILEFDAAWYLALLGGEQELKDAIKLIGSKSESKMTPGQLDTYGYVKLRRFLETDRTVEYIDLVRSSIRVYLTSHRTGIESPFAEQKLGQAMIWFVKLGGETKDIP